MKTLPSPLHCCSPPGSPAPLRGTEEVIVEGTRPEIEQRVNTFVKGVTLLDGWRKRAPRLYGTPHGARLHRAMTA